MKELNDILYFSKRDPAFTLFQNHNLQFSDLIYYKPEESAASALVIDAGVVEGDVDGIGGAVVVRP